MELFWVFQVQNDPGCGRGRKMMGVWGVRHFDISEVCLPQKLTH